MACLDEGVLELLYNNSKNDFDVDYLLAHTLEYILEGALGGKCIFHHGYMNKFDWSDTYVHFCHDHKYKIPMIYQYYLNVGR